MSVLVRWLCIGVSGLLGVCAVADDTQPAKEGGVPVPTPAERLQFAVILGDLKSVDRLLEDGVSPDVASEGSLAPVETALILGHIEIADRLIARGAVGIWKEKGVGAALERAIRWKMDALIAAASAAGWKDQHDLVGDVRFAKVREWHAARTEKGEEPLAGDGRKKVGPPTPIEWFAPPWRPEWAGATGNVRVFVRLDGVTCLAVAEDVTDRALAAYLERMADGLLSTQPRVLSIPVVGETRLKIELRKTEWPADMPDRAGWARGSPPIVLRRVQPAIPVGAGYLRRPKEITIPFVVEWLGWVGLRNEQRNKWNEYDVAGNQAILQWLFMPGMLDGRPRGTGMVQIFRFASVPKEKR